MDGIVVCTPIETERGFEYESLSTGQKIHYSRMIDAATTFQKVQKIE